MSLHSCEFKERLIRGALFDMKKLIFIYKKGGISLEVLKKAAAAIVLLIVILSTVFPSFAFAEIDSDVVDIDLNGNKVIENRLKRGSVKGFKSDEQGKGLQGAVFGLFREEETDFKKDNALMTDMSDENGFFEFLDVPFGRYKIYEVSSPKGYRADGKIYEAVIDDNCDVVDIFSCNHPVTIAKTGDKALPESWSAAGISALIAGATAYIGYRRNKAERRTQR